MAYNEEKTSTLCSILQEVLAADISARIRRMTTSFEDFRTTLISHSVERPPYSVGIFDASDVKHIVGYVLKSYYRHFKLYRLALGKVPRLVLTQARPGMISEPRARRPLRGALKLGRPENGAVNGAAGADAASNGGGVSGGATGAAMLTAEEQALVDRAVESRMVPILERFGEQETSLLDA